MSSIPPIDGPPSSKVVRPDASEASALGRTLEPSPPPPLVLAASDPPRLLYERAHEPSDDSPIVYRERAFAVDSLLTDEELEAHLASELQTLRESLRDRQVPQFIQLASFDHSFDDEPRSPPIATLSWKDWQGRAEIWVRGAQKRSSIVPEPLHPVDLHRVDAAAPEVQKVEEAPPPPPVQAKRRETLSPPAFSNSQPALSNSQPPAFSNSQPPLHSNDELPSDDEWGRADDVLSAPPSSSVEVAAPRSERQSDSSAVHSSPSQSGHYPVARIEEESIPPPSSERVLASEELIGALFERMHELLYLPDIATGADYVLDTISELIPCDAAVVHVFDLDARDFVVVRARGPHAEQILLRRTASQSSRLDEALRRGTTQRQNSDQLNSPDSLWAVLGLSVERALCGPVQQQGRYLGAIEIGLGPERADFSEAHVNAIDYICEQFADFVAQRPIVLDSASLLPSAPRPSPGAP